MDNIAVGIDFSDITSKLVTHAAGLAKAMNATLHLVHFYTTEPAYVDYSVHNRSEQAVPEAELKDEKQQLQALADDLKHGGVDAMAYMRKTPSGANIKDEQTVAGLIEFAEQQQAGMLIVGTHGHNLVERLMLGSVAEGAVRKSTIPVLVVPDRG